MTTPMASAPKQLETKWTAGPWVSLGSHESEGFDCYWIKAQPSPMLRGFTKDVAAVTGPQGGEAEANARLIAAAPEMAKLIADIEESLTADGTYRLLREACQQMLAKIGGDA